jgi:hypothetical protein
MTTPALTARATLPELLRATLVQAHRRSGPLNTGEARSPR